MRGSQCFSDVKVIRASNSLIDSTLLLLQQLTSNPSYILNLLTVHIKIYDEAGATAGATPCFTGFTPDTGLGATKPELRISAISLLASPLCASHSFGRNTPAVYHKYQLFLHQKNKACMLVSGRLGLVCRLPSPAARLKQRSTMLGQPLQH